MLIFNKIDIKTKYILKAILLTLIVGFSSCDDNLEVNPADFLTPEAVLANGGNLQNILVAAYDFDMSIKTLFGSLCFGHTLFPITDSLKKDPSLLTS